MSSVKTEKDLLSGLLQDVMQIEKRYAHEQYGARNDRRNEIKKLVNRVAAELPEMERTNGN